MIHPDVLLEQLSWEQWVEWRERYEANPWGEEREDLRAAVSIAYGLLPVMPDRDSLPSIVWPYFTEDTAIDFDAYEQALAEHKRKYNLP